MVVAEMRLVIIRATRGGPATTPALDGEMSVEARPSTGPGECQAFLANSITTVRLRLTQNTHYC